MADAAVARDVAQSGDVLAHLPAQLAFDREWYETAWGLFPEWHSDRQAFDLALNLSQKLIEGMAISNFTHAREYDKAQLLNYLEAKVRELKPSGN